MNIIAQKGFLLKAVSLLSQIISNKPQSRPILANILLKAEGQKLILNSTDMEMGLHMEIPVENCYEEGVVLLPAHQLLGILKETNVEQIQLEVLERTALLTGKGFQYKLPAYANEEFPELPEMEGQTFPLDQVVLHRVLREVSYAMNRDKNRLQLNSILLCIHGDQLEAVATDQARLAFSRTQLQQEQLPALDGEDLKMVLPSKAMPVLSQILSQSNKSVELSVGDSQVTFRFDGGFFIVRLVEAQFPNYRDAYGSYSSIPNLQISTQDMLQAIRSMILLTCENAKNIALILEKGLLTLKISTPLGEGKYELEVEYDGEPLTVGTNPFFMQDFLKEVDSQGIETIFLKLVGPRKPIIVYPHDNYLYFMSPVSAS
jgi:DNA polymerase III subunit beta